MSPSVAGSAAVATCVPPSLEPVCCAAAGSAAAAAAADGPPPLLSGPLSAAAAVAVALLVARWARCMGLVGGVCCSTSNSLSSSSRETRCRSEGFSSCAANESGPCCRRSQQCQQSAKWRAVRERGRTSLFSAGAEMTCKCYLVGGTGSGAQGLPHTSAAAGGLRMADIRSRKDAPPPPLFFRSPSLRARQVQPERKEVLERRCFPVPL